MSRPFLLRFLLCLGVAVLLLPCRAQKDPSSESPLTHWIAAVTLAANRKDRAEFARLANLPAEQVPAWIFETSTPQWQGTLLTTPDSKTRFVTFSAWHTLESDGDHLHPIAALQEGFRLGAETEKETESGDLHIVHHALTVGFQPTRKSAQLTDAVEFHWQGKPASSAIVRLSNDFQVKTIQHNNAQGQSVSFKQSGGFIALETPQDSDFTLYFDYEGVVSHRGSDYIQETEATLNSYWYPHIARQPTTATISVKTPLSAWTALSIGELEKETRNPDGTRTLLFRNETPVCFYTVTAGRYYITTRTIEGRQLSTYLRDDHPAAAENYLNQLQEALAFFDKTFGKFPYSRYAIVDLRGAFSGALESYSFATFGPGMLPGTIVHELAHTWWGGLVTCTYTRSMWNESFAEYSDELFGRAMKRMPALSASRSPELRRNAAAFRAFTMVDAHDTSDSRQDTIGYEKGKLVLRVLEEEIGKEQMLASVRAFLAAHARGKPAEWSDFEKIVTKTTGKDYRWFFAQWAERTGLPALALQNVRVVKRGTHSFVEGDIVQFGTPYRLTLPLKLEAAGGKFTDHTLVADKSRTAFRFPLNSPLAGMVLDPQRVLPLAAPAGTPADLDPTHWRARN